MLETSFFILKVLFLKYSFLILAALLVSRINNKEDYLQHFGGFLSAIFSLKMSLHVAIFMVVAYGVWLDDPWIFGLFFLLMIGYGNIAMRVDSLHWKDLRKPFTQNYCDSCGFTQDRVFVTEYFTEGGLLQCDTCIAAKV